MSARATSDSGKLDEISLRIGELSGYVHEHRHGVNNLSAKFDAVALDMTRRVEALDVKMTIRIDEINANLTTKLEAANARIGVLESIQDQHKGARNLASPGSSTARWSPGSRRSPGWSPPSGPGPGRNEPRSLRATRPLRDKLT